MTKVLVVGGGIAGTTFIKAARKLPWEITLVDPKEFFEVPFAALRGLMDPDGFGRTTRQIYRNLIGIQHLQAKVEQLAPGKAKLDNGTEVTFDYAVIATGSTIRGFDGLKGNTRQSLAEREAQWAGEHAKLRAADSIAILGGGPIGVELAGEIAAAFPAKKVILVEQNAQLLPALGAKVGNKTRTVLEALGVEVITARSAEIKGTTIVLASGRVITSDLVYQSKGIVTETGFLKNNFLTAINERNQIKVDEFLRLRGSTTIFAIGDINDIAEIKLGALASVQAKLAVKNIKASLVSSKLKAYKPMNGSLGVVTLGRQAGIVKLPFGRLDFLIGMKQKDMLTSTYLKHFKTKRDPDSAEARR